MICDLDGDGLKDLILIDDTNLSIFFQDGAQGFTHEPQQIIHLENRPCFIWAAKLGRPAESLLVMTSDGVTELNFTNRTSPPLSRQIIRQPTIVPVTAVETNVMPLSLAVQTGGDWPLLLVSAADGLEVWQHRDEWVQAQVIGHAVDASLRPSVADAGYTTSQGFDLSISDVNGDGLDDIMVSRSDADQTNTYSLYLQLSNGVFAPEPSLTYSDRAQLHSWLGWMDINRDGKVDLIKSVWLNEPSFMPGVPSGKVVVRTYLADARGRISTEAQQVFRKNDWTPALPVVDVDGDGYPDLVLGFGHLDSKDDLRKQVTAKELDYTLRFFFQRPGSGFAKEADFQRDVVIHMDELHLLMSFGQSKYFERFVKLAGDFNGDGKMDLLVRDKRDEISVYYFISREKGFSEKPDLRFTCPEQIDSWEVRDLNNDGMSDLIVKLGKQNSYRIFMSQK